jgi:hypothetical protein
MPTREGTFEAKCVAFNGNENRDAIHLYQHKSPAGPVIVFGGDAAVLDEAMHAIDRVHIFSHCVREQSLKLCRIRSKGLAGAVFLPAGGELLQGVIGDDSDSSMEERK